jgi:hypothetical protein
VLFLSTFRTFEHFWEKCRKTLLSTFGKSAAKHPTFGKVEPNTQPLERLSQTLMLWKG